MIHRNQTNSLVICTNASKLKLVFPNFENSYPMVASLMMEGLNVGNLISVIFSQSELSDRIIQKKKREKFNENK